MRPQYLICSLVLAVLFPLPSVLGQEKQLYSGPFQVHDYSGQAVYHYRMEDTDTIYDGSFQLQSANLKDLLQKEDSSFSIKGNFKNDYPSGFWTFRFNEFRSDSTSSLDKYQYLVNVNGVQSVASGTLKKGKPDGKWTCAVQHIKNSQIDFITFQSTIEFEDGIPQQNFTIKDSEQELVGMFLRSGVAHDEWTLFSDNDIDARESWRFNEGVLETIALQNEQGIQTIIPIFDTSGNKTATVPLDSAYLDIIKSKLSQEYVSQLIQSSIFKLLTKNDQYYANIDAILSNLATASFSPQFKVNVPYFPLTSSESKRLDIITEHYQKAKSISDSLLENTQIHILKLSDSKVQSLEASAQQITEKILKPIGTIVAYYKDETLPFISRKELISQLWTDGIPEVSEMVKGNSSNSDKRKPTYSLKTLQRLSEESLQELYSIYQLLTKKISKQKRAQQSVVLEKKMIAQIEYLGKLQDSINVDSIPKVFSKVIGQIKDKAKTTLSEYSEMDNGNKKLNYAQKLVDCFEQLGRVGESIVELPNQQYIVQSTFEDEIWNPFTATIMIEQVKKRIVDSYKSVLIPYFLAEIKAKSPCDDVAPWINLVNTTYDRVLALRQEETKKLERKLRKEKDPVSVLQLLKVSYD